MMTKPLVSVVLCTFNDERFIKETIESVLNQTYQNFEFIIWNDGSTDGTERIVKSFNDSRIKYFYHDNTGVGKAAQLACSQVKGKYIARIDGDDVCFPNRLQKEVSFLEEHTDYVVVSSSVYYIDETGSILGRTFPATSNKALQCLLAINNPIVHPASMFRTSAFLESGGYVGIKQSLDHVLFGRLRKLGKIKNFQTPLLKYRLRRSSLSHRISGSGYDKILTAYRRKIINDAIIDTIDVDIYNQLFLESRKQKVDIDNGCPLYRKSPEEWLYEILGGGKVSESIICSLKNIYCRIKYRASEM